MSTDAYPPLSPEPFRAALRFYPSRWRREREDEVLGVLLDVAEAEGRNTPSLAVRTDLAARGLAERLNTVVPAAARHWASLLALSIGVILSLHIFFLGEWGPWVTNDTPYDQPVETFGVFTTPYALVCLLWLAAAISALTRRTQRVRAFAASIVLFNALTPLLTMAMNTWPLPAPLLLTNAGLALIVVTTPLPARASQRVIVIISALVLGGLALYRTAELNGWQTYTYTFYASWGDSYNAVTIAWIGCLAFLTLLAPITIWQRTIGAERHTTRTSRT